MFLPLFVPAHNDKLRQKASQLDDEWEIILDLEDAVPLDQKGAARQGVVDFLAHKRSTTSVRINPIAPHETKMELSQGEADLCEIVQVGLTSIVLPKVETCNDLIAADATLRVLEAKSGMLAGVIEIVALVESARGIANLSSIVTAKLQRPWRLAFGAGDYTMDLNIDWTDHEYECETARAMVVLWSRAAGLPGPIDSAFPGITKKKAFMDSARKGKSVGFAGKFLIHPSQRHLALEAFLPTTEDREWAEKIVNAAADERGSQGAFMLDGAMVMLKRDPKLSAQVFRKWWLSDHTQLAGRIPGLIGYNVNLSKEEGAMFDGISELIFEDEAAWETAQVSQELKVARNDSAAHTSQRVALVVTSHRVIG